MSWWGSSMYDGDLPMDALLTIQEKLPFPGALFPVDSWSEDFRENVRDFFNAMTPNQVFAKFDVEFEDPCVFTQVLVDIMMTSGSKIPKWLRDAAIVAVDTDHHRTDVPGRELMLDRFKLKVQKHRPERPVRQPKTSESTRLQYVLKASRRTKPRARKVR